MLDRHAFEVIAVEEAPRGADETDPVRSGDVYRGARDFVMGMLQKLPEEARDLYYLRPQDSITLNKAHLLHDAKARVIGMADSSYRPPLPRTIVAAGLDAEKTIAARVWGMVEGGYASEHDALIAGKLAFIVTGGERADGLNPVEESYFLEIEREAFVSLAGEAKSQERMGHMLKMIPYENIVPDPVELPEREDVPYIRPPMADQTFVDQLY